MISRLVICILILSLIGLSTAIGQSKNNSNIEKSRQTAHKLASDSKDLAEIKMSSGEKLKGRITSVETDSFSFSDSTSGKSQTILFSEVEQIKKSRKGLSTGAWIAIGAGAAAVIVVAALYRSIYCNEQAC